MVDSPTLVARAVKFFRTPLGQSDEKEAQPLLMKEDTSPLVRIMLCRVYTAATVILAYNCSNILETSSIFCRLFRPGSHRPKQYKDSQLLLRSIGCRGPGSHRPKQYKDSQLLLRSMGYCCEFA